MEKSRSVSESMACEHGMVADRKARIAVALMSRPCFDYIVGKLCH